MELVGGKCQCQCRLSWLRASEQPQQHNNNKRVGILPGYTVGHSQRFWNSTAIVLTFRARNSNSVPCKPQSPQNRGVSTRRVSFLGQLCTVHSGIQLIPRNPEAGHSGIRAYHITSNSSIRTMERFSTRLSTKSMLLATTIQLSPTTLQQKLHTASRAVLFWPHFAQFSRRIVSGED